jgi:membrane protein
MFMVFPNRRNNAVDSLPGALLASFGWLTFSDIFSIYVENFSGYSNIYGSVYAVALSMLWLYFCISIFFYGGALNHILAARRHNHS